MKKKGSGLKYVPVNDFLLIPKYLIEQVKPLTFDIDRLYRFVSASPSFWQFNIVGVFADHQHVIKGFMWLALNPVASALHWNILSVDKEYQHKGVLGEAVNICKRIMKETGAAKVIGETRAPRALERFGFRKSPQVRVELEGER